MDDVIGNQYSLLERGHFSKIAFFSYLSLNRVVCLLGFYRSRNKSADSKKKIFFTSTGVPPAREDWTVTDQIRSDYKDDTTKIYHLRNRCFG